MNVDPLVRPAPLQTRRPRLTEPTLMCTSCRKPTVHLFIEWRTVGAVGDYEHRYQCGACTTERRYGLFR